MRSQGVIALFTSAVDCSLFTDINGLSGAPLPDHLFTFVAQRFEIVLIALVTLAFLIPWRAHHRQPERA